MIDLDHLAELLYQHTLESPNVAKEKIRFTLSLALQKQCNENLNTIFKYKNQWDKTKIHNLNGLEDNDPVARLIRLLFDLIIDDINSNVINYEKSLSK